MAPAVGAANPGDPRLGIVRTALELVASCAPDVREGSACELASALGLELLRSGGRLGSRFGFRPPCWVPSRASRA